MFNWITPNETNLVLYQDGTTIKSYNQATATSTTILPVVTNTRAPSIAPIDVWAYIAGPDTAGVGGMQANIFDGVNTDLAFRAPPVITNWAAVDAGSGQCTQGQHFIGFVYQNRTGYSGKPVTSINYAITATASATFSVTATTNASPDVLTAPGHTFVNGQVVTGSGSTGDTAINGVFLVAGVSGSTLRLTDLQGNQVNGNGVYTGGASLKSADLITATGNNLVTGQSVVIAGSTGDTAINGNGVVTVVTPGSTFNLTDISGNIINSNGAYTGGGVLTNPIQITLAAGLRQINIAVTLPALTDGGTDANGEVQATLFLIATRAGNKDTWYFLPTDFQTGEVGEQPVPHNAPVTLNFVMNLSDETISSTLSGDLANDNFNFLCQGADGFGPFNPSFVAAYGTRMCYGAGTTMYVSDLSAPQQIAADRNAVRMQNQRTIGFAFPLPGNTGLYLTGDRWTGYVTDNNDTPSTWSVPVQVSTTLGAPFPNCVCADTGGPWAWIVTEAGPYLFDGNYELNPLTYLVSGLDEDQLPMGWKRVNWKAAYAIKVVDDVQNLKLYVAVPMDGAFECNYQFCIDYRMGKGFDSVDISLDVFNPQFFSSIAVVKEFSTGLTNLWKGPSAAGNVVRFDVTTHNDEGNAIDGYWTSGLARGKNIASAMVRVGAMDIWARGNAPLDANGNPLFLITLFGPDGVQSVDITLMSTQGVAAALVDKPGITYMSKFDISQIEDWYVQFRTNSVDCWMELSAFTAYERADLANR